MNVNKVTLGGRLTADPEIRFVNDKSVVSFSIAVDRSFNKEKTDFFNCTMWGKRAETIHKHFHKGSRILLCGRIENDSWEADGVKKYSTKIVMDDFWFVDKKSDNETQKETGGFQRVDDDGDELLF